MDKNISIEEFFNDSNNQLISKNKKSPVASILIIALSLVIFIVSESLKQNLNGTMFSALIIMAVILAISGVFAFLFRKKQYKYKNGQNINIKDYYFNIKERDKLVKMVENKQLELDKLEKSTQDALKLRIASTADKSYCVAQVVVYIPYEFVNATAPVEIDGSRLTLPND